MREAMLRAEVGDDVIDIDPTVEALQSKTAELLGKQAAIFMPSGTMTNQIALRVHCLPGEELTPTIEVAEKSTRKMRFRLFAIGPINMGYKPTSTAHVFLTLRLPQDFPSANLQLHSIQ